MQKNIIAIVSIVILLTGALVSCRKDVINGASKDLVLGSYLTLKQKINTNLNFSSPTATVSIRTGSYGSPVASVNIYLATGDALDTKKWKLIKNVPFADSATLVVTTAEISAALAPGSIQPGNQYVLQNEVVTKDGRKFSAANTPTNYTSFPAYNIAFSWNATAVCAFSQANSIGTYKVVYDGDWVDYKTGDLITVTAGPDANSIQFLAYPSEVLGGGTNRQPWIVKVDAATGGATVADQFVGNYGSTVARVKASGFVFSCTGFITLSVDVNYGGSIYAAQKFTLQKQ